MSEFRVQGLGFKDLGFTGLTYFKALWLEVCHSSLNSRGETAPELFTSFVGYGTSRFRGFSLGFRV